MSKLENTFEWGKKLGKSYIAGNGINIDDDSISVNTNVIATKKYVDDNLDTKQNKLTPEQLAVINPQPQELSSNDDLNNLNIPSGKWVIKSRYTYVPNLPSDLPQNYYSGYIEYTTFNTENSQGLQRFYPRTNNLSITDNVGIYYQRQYIDNGWTPWYKFNGVKV